MSETVSKDQAAPVLGRVHLAIGLVGVLIFAATGLYMDRSLDHLVGMADAPRALYRSGHIYILLSALLHLLLGAYAMPRSARAGRVCQYAASVVLTAALALFVYGFVVETPLAQVERPMTRLAIELSLGGTLLHCAAAAVFRPAGAPVSAPGGPRLESGDPADPALESRSVSPAFTRGHRA